MTQRTLVVKVGTSLLRAGDEFLQALAANLSAERQSGKPPWGESLEAALLPLLGRGV